MATLLFMAYLTYYVYQEIDDVLFNSDIEVSTLISNINWGEIGGALVCLGVILAIGQLIKDWISKKGYRMVVKDRNDKKHALLLEILQDGLLQAELDEKLSRKEVDEVFMELATKHGFRDLVPKKRMQRIVKNELKAARAKREQARALGNNDRPRIPGDPPTPIVRKRFSERLGKAAFWAGK